MIAIEVDPTVGPDQEPTTISVIVPTMNRPQSVLRAVRSALNQSLSPYEVVVVVDGPDPVTVRLLEGIDDRRVTVVELAENGGAARARNIGVATSTGEWVAFLDDDDEWRPNKLRAQAIAAASAGDTRRLILATGFERRGDVQSDWWPLRAPLTREPVADYLFVRRQPGEGMLQTSTIMLRREFAKISPFPEYLPIHEEWDWFIELEKAGGRFSVVMEPLVIFNAPASRLSVSSSAQWDTSLAWVLSRRRDMSQKAFSDFCLTEVARLARSTGGLRAAAAVFFVASTGRLSSFAIARFVAICLVPDSARRRITARLPKSPEPNETGTQ